MKTQLKAKEDEDQIFKFRTRLIKIEDIMEEEELSDNAMDFDERLLSGTSKNEQVFTEMVLKFSCWLFLKFMLHFLLPLCTFQMIPVEEDKKIEEEWELIHETFSKSLVRVHSLLYGSIGVVENVSAQFFLCSNSISFLVISKLSHQLLARK